MVALSLIEQGLGSKNPDIAAVLQYLDNTAGPQDVTDKPLPIISGAVNEMHSVADMLETELSPRGRKASTFGRLIGSKFDSVTDCYVALAGIGPPTDPLDAIKLKKEVDFAKKLIDIIYGLAQKTGASTSPLSPVLVPDEDLTRAYTELKSLQDANRLPDYAQSNHMKRSMVGGGIGVIFFLVYIVIRFGLLSDFVQYLQTVFHGK